MVIFNITQFDTYNLSFLFPWQSNLLLADSYLQFLNSHSAQGSASVGDSIPRKSPLSSFLLGAVGEQLEMMLIYSRNKPIFASARALGLYKGNRNVISKEMNKD